MARAKVPIIPIKVSELEELLGRIESLIAAPDYKALTAIVGVVLEMDKLIRQGRATVVPTHR